MAKVNTRPECAAPANCRAKGAGLCQSCTLRSREVDPGLTYRERDADILRRLQAGESTASVCRLYRITRGRVWQIRHKAELRAAS